MKVTKEQYDAIIELRRQKEAIEYVLNNNPEINKMLNSLNNNELEINE